MQAGPSAWYDGAGDIMELVVKRFSELTNAELYELLKLRCEVFVVEQRCAYLDVDGRDLEALHVFLRDEGGVCACARVLPQGAAYADAALIGRVIAKRRGEGLGERVVRAGIAAARGLLGASRLRVEAQSYARGFYEKCGFACCTAEFDEDGIPHVGMVLEIE